MLFYLLIIGAQILAAVWFVRFVIIHDRGSKEPRAAIRTALLFGLLALFLVTITSFLQENQFFVGLEDGTGTLSNMFIASIIIGLIEESAKSIPLALWIYKKPFFNETTDGIFYFGMSGVVFALIENIEYTIVNGAETGLSRLIMTPFLHIGFAMLFGFFLARYKVTGKSKALVALGLFGSISLHALYDFGLFSGIGWLMLLSAAIGLTLNIGVFKLYRYAQAEDAKLNLSADGTNHFCRSCGRPNPDHTLFCIYCGQHT